MLATIVLAVLCMIALQIVLVVKVADLLTVRSENSRAERRDVVPGSAGRFTGIA